METDAGCGREVPRSRCSLGTRILIGCAFSTGHRATAGTFGSLWLETGGVQPPSGSKTSRTYSARRMPMYVVLGATGHSGNVVAEKLLATKQKVRVVGRDGRRLEPLKQKGAEPFVADVTDAAALTRAFSGAEAAYLMVPPNISSPNVLAYQQRVNDALAASLQQSGIRHVVVLSSIGAD